MNPASPRRSLKRSKDEQRGRSKSGPKRRQGEYFWDLEKGGSAAGKQQKQMPCKGPSLSLSLSLILVAVSLLFPLSRSLSRSRSAAALRVRTPYSVHISRFFFAPSPLLPPLCWASGTSSSFKNALDGSACCFLTVGCAGEFVRAVMLAVSPPAALISQADQPTSTPAPRE